VKKLTAAATAFLAMLIALPLMTAAFVVSSAPAVAQAVQCTTAGLPPTGAWRPPFQQAYAVSPRGFGLEFHPIYHQWRQHTGQDMSSLPDPGPVVAAARGTITSAGPAGGYGNLVVLDHGAGVSTYYAHLASISPDITPGAPVWMGQQLGVEGTTGTSTGNHLHFEVRQDGTPIDPIPFMLAHGAPLNGQAVAPSSPPGTGPSDPGGQQGGIGFTLPPPGTPRLNSLSNPPQPIPAEHQDPLPSRRRPIPPALDPAGRDRHGRDRTRTHHRHQLSRRPRPHAVHARDLGAVRRRRGRRRPRRHHQRRRLGNERGELPDRLGSHRRPRRRATRDLRLQPRRLVRQRRPLLRRRLRRRHRARRPQRLRTRRDRQPQPAPHRQRRDRRPAHLGQTHIGDPYVFGANGPDAWDCSSFTQAAYAQIGISIPRTASAQRNWLAAGNGFRVPAGQERPGDLLFVDSYLGPNQIGHVMIVYDPATHLTVEAGGAKVGNYDYSQWADHHIYEFWRVGATH
jgi:cell wall-associated NlpC family hydrolase